MCQHFSLTHLHLHSSDTSESDDEAEEEEEYSDWASESSDDSRGIEDCLGEALTVSYGYYSDEEDDE